MDLTTLTDSSVSLLHSHISEQKTSKIRYRTLVDLQDDWPSICGQPCSENEFIFYDDKLPQVINKVWDWIGARLVEEMDLIDSFQSLHLLPMKGKKLRKLRGALTSPAALVTDPASKIGKLLYELTAIDELRGPPIIDKGLLAASAMETIQRLASKHPGMEIAQSNTIRFLARWLFAGKHLIVDASKSWKEEIVECLSEVLKETSDDHQAITEAVPMIRQLPIFRRVKNRHVTQTALCHVKYIRTRTGQFDREYSPLQLEWSSITDDATNVKADLLPVIPDIADLEFYDVSNVDGRFVATFIPILGPGDLEYLLRSRIVPWLCNELTKTPSTVKKTFIDFIFDNTPKFSNEWRSFLRRQDIVPLQRIGNCQQEFGSLMQVIDLKSLTLRALYFAEEKVFPDENFARRFDAVLASCNIRRSITADLIKERIEFYARCGKDIGAVAKRVKYMLQLPSLSAILSDSAVQHTISNRIWIPASSPTNLQLTMMAAKACRDERDRDLIDGVLGTLDYRVDRTWRLALGWKEPLGLAELITQLERWVNAKIFEKVDAVLHYIKRNVGKAEYVSALSDVQWVLGASSNYFTPSHVFSRGDYAAFSSLVPYLDTVDRQFYAKHTALINDLAVEETPSLEILLSVQEELGTSAPLADHGFKVAVAIMKLAAQTFPRGMLNNLMAPDEQRRLTKIADLTCSDTDSRNPNLESLKFVHPDVPPSILQRLEITSIRETIIRGEVEELDHEEEYAQQESLTTTIRDTLERYTVKSVFNEYLANADDCGASEIRWLLDDRAAGIHSSDLLLTHELRVTLGPALLVYNDKEFSEDDFLGFRRIGQGSKRANVDTVGMFGRGAITMYHYTDVPMLISGSSMVIFDPQGRVLPRRRSGERKLGVRLPLSYVRRVCPDQLAPFRGVFGFQDTDHFHGTIFRFALRNPECQTELTETTSYASLSKTKRQFEGYFNDARASLLFLRHVSKVEYHVQGQQQPAWSVSAERPPLSGFVFPLRVHYEQLQLGGRSNEGADDWWVAIADIENAPKEIEYPWKRALKRIECGVAACVKASAPVKPRIFCVLPTPFPNSLPISIHASFAISADRQTIPYQDSARVSESSWNQWLIEEQLPDLYLRFLKDLALSTNGIYDFWPTRRALPHDTFQLGKIQEAFWKRLSANSEYHDLALFPVTTPTKSSGQLLPGQSQHRRTPKNMATLRNGEFDLLSGPVSELLRPLLSRVCDNLVCLPDGPRREIADVVKSINGISLSSSYLCEVFKRPKGVTVLQEYASSNEKIASLLHEMMPKNRGPMTTTDERTCSESWEVLMGCTIVPLEDGSLGTLLGAAVKDAPIYYLATVEELSLFEFASDIMVRHLLPTKQACALSAPPLSAKGVMKKSTNLDTIADTNFFNIKRISVSDSGKILRHSQCPIQSRGVSLAAKVRWLRSFWQWMNNNSADSQTAVHASQLTQCTLADLPIYPAESGMVIKTPSQFELHACVLQSEDKEDLELFQKIPGLVVIESLCVPWALRQDETDLEAPNARLRFLEALARLQNTTDLQTSLNENLDEKLAKKLQRLVVDFCTLCNHDALNPLLKRLPIWPRYRKTSSPGLVSTYMASEHAFACDNSYVHLPWMPRLDRCILPEVAVRYRNILHRLGVTVMSTLERLPMIIKHLPKAIDENRYPGIWPRYEGFLAHLHQKCLSVALKDPKIALKDVGFIPDGTGALRTACSLFEHSDPLFIAAFRVESNVRFPHHSVRHHQDLLLRLGMRRRQHGNLQWEDYIECASAIQQRYADRMSDVDEELLRDATVVFDRIRGDSAHLKTWPKSCWERIFKIGNAPTLSSNTIAENSSYRHGRMQQIAGRTPLRSIESSTPKKYLSISWSSSAYVEHEPPEHVVSLLPRAGAPLPSKVYKHLTYLMGIREFVAGNELVAFLKEIRDCYDFLQQHMPGETYFTTKQDRVWVNLESTELEYVSMSDFEASITSVDLLCLKSAVDPLPAKAVRPFLVPYEKLLKAFGCKSIQRRKINTTLLARERQPSVMTEIHRFRSEGKLVDVTFKAQDQLIRAHRVVLAASWGYCATLFTGSQWKESLKPSEPIELDDLTAQTVETMVEYAYSGSYVWPKVSTSDDNDSIADDLDELLDLLRGTDRMQIVAFHGEVEAHLIENAEIYIRPDNVKEVQKLADQAQARSLKNHCDGFIEDNKDIVEVCSPERS
ncbi:MAG: hypothetical protein M1833_002554 [Piccolia ochrophora]|nr:MAG: hypothetical protein M1833_002554 [Piccolia ochrophora]